MELRPKDAAIEGTLVLPFGLALDRGVRLQIDDGQTLPPLHFRTCLPAGCLVNLSFDAKTVSFLRKGTRLKVAVVADGGKETQLAISLKGVSGALDRTIALLN